MFEAHKHASALESAQFELEEEAGLRSEEWVPLLRGATTSAPFDKYSNNTFFPFLALDCEEVAQPRPMDDEEHITVLRNITHPQLMQWVCEGRINVLSSYTALLGISKLREMGIQLDANDDHCF